MDKEAEYYSNRAAAQMAMAQRATSPAVVAAHYKLSSLYLERAQALAEPAVPDAVAA